MTLDPYWVAEYRKRARGLRILNIQIEKLSKKELIAVVACGWFIAREEELIHKRFLLDLLRGKPNDQHLP